MTVTDLRPTEKIPEVNVKVDAAGFAFAWQTTRLAASELRQTQIEVFRDDGLLLTCTNGFVLIQIWVPFHDWSVTPPRIEELPDVTILAYDPDNRVYDMAKYLGRRKPAEIEGKEVSIRTVKASSDQPALSEQLTAIEIEFDFDGKERISIGRMEMPPVDWRSMFHRWEAGPVSETAFSSVTTPAIKALADVCDTVKLRFGAPTRELGGDPRPGPIMIEAEKDDHMVIGFVMPAKGDE